MQRKLKLQEIIDKIILLYTFFFFNRYNILKYRYFVLYGQIEKYRVLAYTKKKFGKLAFLLS